MTRTVSETTSRSFAMMFCCTCRRLRLSDSALTWLASVGVVMKGEETNILQIFGNRFQIIISAVSCTSTLHILDT